MQWLVTLLGALRGAHPRGGLLLAVLTALVLFGALAPQEAAKLCGSWLNSPAPQSPSLPDKR